LGLLKVIKIIKEKYDSNVVLLNIGFGPDTQLYDHFVKQNNLTENVHFLGKLKNEDVIRVIKMCDCFLLTSYNVVFDLVVLEALACGIPVFVSNNGGNKEIIQDGFNGYLIPEHDEDFIANAVMSFDRTRVRTNARRSVQQYSLKAMISNYEKIYEEVIGKH
ncbi:MAG: glycosyltransferase, partial [Bacteroidota bacterium]